MKRDVADLSKTYHNFSDTPLGADIFEFKVEAAPKTNDKKQAELFELKYLSSKRSVRKVMICDGKVCYSSFQNYSGFCHSDNLEAVAVISN